MHERVQFRDERVQFRDERVQFRGERVQFRGERVQFGLSKVEVILLESFLLALYLMAKPSVNVCESKCLCLCESQ